MTLLNRIMVERNSDTSEKLITAYEKNERFLLGAYQAHFSYD